MARGHLLAAACVIGQCLGLPALAQAQDPNNAARQRTATPVMLEEVIVTATRRTENLQEVPMSVSAFTETFSWIPVSTSSRNWTSTRPT